MSESESIDVTKTPKHLWFVAIVSLLWNLMGALDYVLSQTKNEEYLSAFTAEQLSYFLSFPTWVIASWAIAIWGGVLGSIMLLFKTKLAVPAFLASFIGMLVTTIHNYGLSNGFEVLGDTFSLVFTAIIFLTTIALYLYAKAMQKSGVLT